MGFAHRLLEELAAGRVPSIERPNAPAKLAHFVLKTPRPERMIAWYSVVLDAQVVFEDERLAFLTYDDEHHRVAIVKVPRAVGLVGLVGRYLRKVYGIDHVAFTYRDLGGLMANYRRLADAGIRPVWCINHGPTTSLYYEDPDGNRLELQCENFESIQDLASFVQSGSFESNPIGVEFDPDLLERKLRAGVPEAELRERGSAVPPGTKPVAGYRTIRWKTL